MIFVLSHVSSHNWVFTGISTHSDLLAGLDILAVMGVFGGGSAMMGFPSISGKIREIRIWGLGDLGGHFYCNFWKRMAQKLRKIILLHFGLVTFWIHFGRKAVIFMICRLDRHVHDSQNQLFSILETPKYVKKSQRIHTIFWKRLCSEKTWTCNSWRFVK